MIPSHAMAQSGSGIIRTFPPLVFSTLSNRFFNSVERQDSPIETQQKMRTDSVMSH
jgi:hypothetical protein